MDSIKKNGGRTPFKDLTNTTSCDQDASNSLPRDIDSKERKRQRDRERWATMSAEQKNEKTKRRREARQRKKGQPSLTEINKDGDLEEDDEWLHRNETYEPYNFERGDLASAMETTIAPSSLPIYRPIPWQALQEALMMHLRIMKVMLEKRTKRQPQTSADINDNECSSQCPSPAIATSSGVARQGDGEAHPQMMPEFISNADDDDGVIFEEDDEGDEGYLFAGQEEDINEENDVEETQDDSSSIHDVPDPYDRVYSNMPEETHTLRPVPNCKC